MSVHRLYVPVSTCATSTTLCFVAVRWQVGSPEARQTPKQSLRNDVLVFAVGVGQLQCSGHIAAWRDVVVPT